jgi:NADH:ubiquinone oxidoreductase subunit E
MARLIGEGQAIQLATRVPKAIHRDALIAAIEAEQTLQDWIAEALAEHLARCLRQNRARPAAGMPREGA